MPRLNLRALLIPIEIPVSVGMLSVEGDRPRSWASIWIAGEGEWSRPARWEVQMKSITKDRTKTLAAAVPVAVGGGLLIGGSAVPFALAAFGAIAIFCAVIAHAVSRGGSVTADVRTPLGSATINIQQPTESPEAKEVKGREAERPR